jgi:thiol-disulfide isomerase/thioredoxin
MDAAATIYPENPGGFMLSRTRSSFLAWTFALFCLAGFNAHAAPEAGDKPPDEVGFNLERKAVSLKDYAGKAIVISFWATWCDYCLKELPILNNIQKLAGKDRLQVIAVNTESREVFRDAAKVLKTLDILLTHDRDEDGAQAYGVKGIPHMVIVGRDGRIVSVHRGYNESSLKSIAADINRALAAQ